ncbi:P-II family nitrogen regulator [Aerococcaceae bacterium WGS1372]
MWYLIYAIVPSGKVGQVIAAAESAGSRGGTIIHGKGIGRTPKKFFNFEVEPMREIVMIIVEESKYKNVSQAIYSQLNMKEEGMGVVFAEPLNQVAGLVNQVN